jgi:hypothetical protein
MKAVLEETLRAQARSASHRKSPPPGATLQTPVSAEDLGLLERHCKRIGVPLPPSFRRFLLISDGVPGYMQLEGMSLRSSRDIVDSAGPDEAEWDEYDPLHKFVIVSGNTTEFIAFDERSIDAAGEPAIVWVGLRGDETTYANFEDLLWSQHRFQKDVLEAEEADRANLPDD